MEGRRSWHDARYPRPVFIGINFGFWWALLTVVALTFSFFASVKLIEAETSLLVSMLSVLRLTRLGSEVEDLRRIRIGLVERIRQLAERLADPDTQRMFTQADFGTQPAA